MIHETAMACPLCGATQGLAWSGGVAMPGELRGWSWGGFLLSWLWGIFNGTWLALLALVPGFGLIIMVILGIKGREWAWKNRRWDGVEHFRRVQRLWAIWGLVAWLLPFLIAIVLSLAISTYEDYTRRGVTRGERVSIEPAGSQGRAPAALPLPRAEAS